jgi:hypothetical protein
MTAPLFSSLDSAAIAKEIRTARHSICYAAPGIQNEPANAMVEVAHRIGPELITVCLDFDERVMRMGFGDLLAVKNLCDAGIVVNSMVDFQLFFAMLGVDETGSESAP